MANGINKAIIVGNVCADPTTKYLPSGDAVTNTSVATNETYKDKAGVKQDRVEFHRIVFFGKLAEIAGEYLKKGSKVFVEGSLRTRQWEKDGQKHYTTEIVAKEMQLLDRKEPADGNQTPIKKPESGGFDDLGEEDIPW